MECFMSGASGRTIASVSTKIPLRISCETWCPCLEVTCPCSGYFCTYGLWMTYLNWQLVQRAPLQVTACRLMNDCQSPPPVLLCCLEARLHLPIGRRGLLMNQIGGSGDVEKPPGSPLHHCGEATAEDECNQGHHRSQAMLNFTRSLINM